MSQPITVDLGRVADALATDDEPVADFGRDPVGEAFLRLCREIAERAAERFDPRSRLPDAAAEVPAALLDALGEGLRAALRLDGCRFLALPHLAAADWRRTAAGALPRRAALVGPAFGCHLVPLPLTPWAALLPALRGLPPLPPPGEAGALDGYLIALGWILRGADRSQVARDLAAQLATAEGKCARSGEVEREKSDELVALEERLRDELGVAERTRLMGRVEHDREALARARETAVRLAEQKNDLAGRLSTHQAECAPAAWGERLRAALAEEGAEAQDFRGAGLDAAFAAIAERLEIRALVAAPAPPTRRMARPSRRRRMALATGAGALLIAGALGWWAGRGRVEPTEPVQGLEAASTRTIADSVMQKIYASLVAINPDAPISAGDLREAVDEPDGRKSTAHEAVFCLRADQAGKWSRQCSGALLGVKEVAGGWVPFDLGADPPCVRIDGGPLPHAFTIELIGRPVGSADYRECLLQAYYVQGDSGRKPHLFVARGPGGPPEPNSWPSAGPITLDLRVLKAAGGDTMVAAELVSHAQILPGLRARYAAVTARVPELDLTWRNERLDIQLRFAWKYASPDSLKKDYVVLEVEGEPRAGGAPEKIAVRAIRIPPYEGKRPPYFLSRETPFIMYSRGLDRGLLTTEFKTNDPDFAVVEERDDGFDLFYPMADVRIGRVEARGGKWLLVREGSRSAETIEGGPAGPDPPSSMPGDAVPQAVRNAFRLLAPDGT